METNETKVDIATAINCIKKTLNPMTVAEFRNKINPITRYYDNYDCYSFLMDDSISLETKIEVLFGKKIAKLIDYSNIGNIRESIERKIENG